MKYGLTPKKEASLHLELMGNFIFELEDFLTNVHIFNLTFVQTL